MTRYSIFSLLRGAREHHENWPRAWRDPEPKAAYDVIIIGGGNTGRNTTIVRSNYLWDESAAIYEKSLKLWEGLSQELNYNVMFSQRGVMNLAHNQHDLRELSRRVNANRLNGVDSEILSPAEIKAFCPIINISPTARYPVLGASLQRRGGVARHDAVAWGYARAADARGGDIIQNCEVTGIRRKGGRVTGVETAKGFIAAPKVASATAGHSSVVAAMAGLRLPIESHPLQALVSEPIKPVLDTVVMSGSVHVYISQSDRGELVMGAGIDHHLSYAQRSGLHTVEEMMASVIELIPITSRLRMMRQWAGIVDTCPDASPLVCKTPVEGFYVNGGWGTGGFKATPGSGWVYAHTIARDQPHELNAAFSLERFSSGALIDEHGAAAVAH